LLMTGERGSLARDARVLTSHGLKIATSTYYAAKNRAPSARSVRPAHPEYGRTAGVEMTTRVGDVLVLTPLGAEVHDHVHPCVIEALVVPGRPRGDDSVPVTDVHRSVPHPSVGGGGSPGTG
jgi:hypothetical protein